MQPVIPYSRTGVSVVVLGFLSTISFHGGNDYHNPGVLTFCLSGEYRKCNMAELAWRLGFYDQHLVNTEDFGTFLDHCHKEFPKGVVGSTWWSKIAN